jgi:hypothetical protein
MMTTFLESCSDKLLKQIILINNIEYGAAYEAVKIYPTVSKK